MEINSNNISHLIKYLYEKRLNQPASEEVLQSWSNLSDEEAQLHLQQLFQSWNYSPEQIVEEMRAFAQSMQSQAENSIKETQANLSSNYTTAAPAPAQAPYQAPPNNHYPPANEPNYTRPRKKSKAWILVLLLPLLAIGVFVFYKYHQFQNLNYLYVTTDNVSIRDHEGNNIGRMDIFASSNSVSFLRTTDINTYPITVGNNVYECRKVLFDSTSFVDFLFNKPASFGYVNENYVIDDKDNFIIYRNVFKEINTVKNENTSLTSPYRKTIVGSLRKNPALNELFIKNACNNNDKNLSALVKYKNANDIYQVVALLSDGNYYIFTGNPAKQQYDAPKAFEFKVPGDNNYLPLQQENILFKYVNKTYFIFGCDGIAKDYYTAFDENGLISYAKYSFEP